MQVGNHTIDHLYWGRPEDITPSTYGARLVYVVDPAHPAADVVGAAAAALAAVAQARPLGCQGKGFHRRPGIMPAWHKYVKAYMSDCCWLLHAN